MAEEFEFRCNRKRMVNGRVVEFGGCVLNKSLECEYGDCNSCGWNPLVGAKRRLRLRERGARHGA